jgi:hypothetical protein
MAHRWKQCEKVFEVNEPVLCLLPDAGDLDNALVHARAVERDPAGDGDTM